MGELSEIHGKINDVAGEVREISGILKATLPTMATTDAVDNRISSHHLDCQTERKNSSSRIKRPTMENAKKPVAIGVGLFALAEAISAVVRALG